MSYSSSYRSGLGASKLPAVPTNATTRRTFGIAANSLNRTAYYSSSNIPPTSEFKELKIHSQSSGTPTYPLYHTTYNTSSTLAASDVSVSRKPSISHLQMIQPSYIGNSERTYSAEKPISIKVQYVDDNPSELQRPGKKYASAGFRGLRNLGNTCFMNSVIQCLSNSKPLLEYILNGEYRRDLNTTTSTCKGALISAFAELLTAMWDEGSSPVSPSAFKSAIQQFAPRFSGYNQQDSQELLRYLLQGLQEDVNRVRQRVKVKPLDEKAIEQVPIDQRADIYWQHYHKFEDSKIVDIFVGQLKSTLKCSVCGYESTAFDPFWDLSLPIPKGYSSKVDLVQCIANFMKEEILDGQERPRCDRCQKQQPCTKRFSIQRFPNVLVLHLKRFSQGSYGTKLTTQVDFPMNGLDLSKFCDSPSVRTPTYDLYAISNHSGSMYSGHYTAYARHPYELRWYEFNDSRVTAISSRSLVTPEAYVLFYEQVDHLTY